jgi:hypothetical protein
MDMEIIRGTVCANISVLRWFWKKKHHPERQADMLKQLMTEDLVRLAETAPHLLDDIGFRRDPGSRSPTRDVWRRDGLGIVVVRRNAGAEVRIEAPSMHRENAGPAREPAMFDVPA